MRKALVAAVLLLAGGTVNADVFCMSPGLTNLETVVVADPGNVGELSGDGAGGWGPDRICGSVAYTYKIGKYEVTTAQYCDFLNQKAKSDPYELYSTYMAQSNPYNACNIQRSGSDGSYVYTVGNGTSDVALWGNRPVNYVSYWDACRFANWLTNGQGNGNTETGLYTLHGYTGADGRDIVRNPGRGWAVTSEDEWYKAAYYKGGGTNSGYWTFPTRTNTKPSNGVMNPDPGNSANFDSSSGLYSIGSPYYRTNVGEFERSASEYGTFDQGGNVFEWNEAVVSVDDTITYRGQRGGSFFDSSGILKSDLRMGSPYGSSYEGYTLGFRLSYVAVPEPSPVLALFTGFAGIAGLAIRRRI